MHVLCMSVCIIKVGTFSLSLSLSPSPSLCLHTHLNTPTQESQAAQAQQVLALVEAQTSKVLQVATVERASRKRRRSRPTNKLNINASRYVRANWDKLGIKDIHILLSNRSSSQTAHDTKNKILEIFTQQKHCMQNNSHFSESELSDAIAVSWETRYRDLREGGDRKKKRQISMRSLSLRSSALCSVL